MKCKSKKIIKLIELSPLINILFFMVMLPLIYGVMQIECNVSFLILHFVCFLIIQLCICFYASLTCPNCGFFKHTIDIHDGYKCTNCKTLWEFSCTYLGGGYYSSEKVVKQKNKLDSLVQGKECE